MKRRYPSIFLAVVALASLSVFVSPAHATAAPPGVPVPHSATAPAAPTPAPSPVLVQAAVPVLARREETEVTPAATAGGDLGLIQRAVARIAGIPTEGAAVQQLATAQAELATLRQQVATLTTERDAARSERDTSRAAHQADLAALQSAIDSHPAVAATTPAGQQIAAAVTAQVGAHLRSLSHPAANLPATAGGAGADRPDSLREAFRAETDPVKKASLFQQIKRADEAAKSRTN